MGQSTVSKDARNQVREKEENRKNRGNKEEWQKTLKKKMGSKI